MPKKRYLDSTPPIHTTSGSAYIPSANYDFINDVGEFINNKIQYAKNYLKNKLGYVTSGYIELKDKNVSRINSNTNNISSILTNEFVENKKNTIRRKKDFINTSDTLLGDKKIPLSKISTYYGIEDGKLKVGPLSIFNDSTIVVPNRIKRTEKLKKIIPATPASKEYKEAMIQGIDNYNNERNYKLSIGQRLKSGYLFGNDPRAILRANVSNTEYRKIYNKFHTKYKHLFGYRPALGITENNDTISLPKLNATPKVMFGDENGNSVFVSGLDTNLDKLNNFLNNNPSYPILVDNGRYSMHFKGNVNPYIYSGLENPDNMFIIGTTK